MKIYLDIVYLINVYLGILCFLSIGILLNKHYSFKKIVMISFLWGMVVLTIYSKWTYFFFGIWSFIISILIDKKQCLKICFLWLFLYFTYTTSFFYFKSNAFRFGPVLLVETSFQWLYAFLLGTILVILYLGMSFYLHKDVLKQSLYYPVQIKYKNKGYFATGFMDTGNQMVVSGLPIIFTAHTIENGDDVMVQRVGGIQWTKAIEIEIEINGHFQQAYLAFMPDLKLKGADILLNLELL